MTVSVIISYCSIENIFIDVCLKECLKFSDDVIVSYGSHLYNGQPEDLNHIAECQTKFPTVKFVKYQVDMSLDLYKQKGVRNRPTAYWHNLARWTGVQALSGKNDWVFVIDVDEIPEGEYVAKWLDLARSLFNDHECYKVANYWYFKSPRFQATTLEDSVLLINRKYLTFDNIFGDNERDHLIHVSKCQLIRQVKGFGKKVLFHHFSWSKPRTALEHKIKHWAHANDIFSADRVNPDELIEYIYKDNNVNDIVHGYEYNIVENKFDLIE